MLGSAPPAGWIVYGEAEAAIDRVAEMANDALILRGGYDALDVLGRKVVADIATVGPLLRMAPRHI